MKNVIIIGAGPSGLTAAYELLSQSREYRITILEESQEIGGISKTINHNGNRMDIGGHRFFSKDPAIMDWWARVMPLQGAPAKDDLLLKRETPQSPGGPDPEKADRVMLQRHRVSRIFFKKRFFDYPLRLKPQTLLNMGLSSTILAGFSYILSCLHKRQEKSLEDFYINRFGKVLYSMFFESYTEKVWGRHPRRLDADWGAQRVRGLSVFRLITDSLRKAFWGSDNAKIETSLIESFLYPKFGPGQLWEIVASDVESMGAHIQKGCQVRNVRCKGGAVTSVVYRTNTGTEKEIPTDIVISSMPLKDLFAGLEGVNVPDDVYNIAAHLPYRDFITVGLLVDRLLLKNTTDMKTLGNIIPDCWIYIQEPGVKVGRLQIFNNWSPYMVQKPERQIWLGMEYFCNEGDALWNLSDEEGIALGISEMEKMGIIEPGAVHDACRVRVKKAYPAYFDSYAQIGKLIETANRIKNLYCVGRNGQHRYNNMDHSMLTAIQCVKTILNGGENKSAIWKVNTEKEYHESK